MKPPSWSSLSSLLLLTLPTGSIAGIIINRGTEDTQDQPQTCRPEISCVPHLSSQLWLMTNTVNRPFDYSAKLRSVYELPVCSAGDETGGIHGRNDGGSNDVSFLAAESLSFLTGRQVVGLDDDYTCAPDRPCKNKACCPKATLQCNYGPEYVFFSVPCLGRTRCILTRAPGHAARRESRPMKFAGTTAMPKQSAVNLLTLLGRNVL